MLYQGNLSIEPLGLCRSLTSMALASAARTNSYKRDSHGTTNNLPFLFEFTYHGTETVDI